MLKKLTIRNFKAIEDMTIEFSPLTVLIGGNGCGKSTVLQALDFLRSAAFRDIPEYLNERGWSFSEIKSQLHEGQNKPIEFISEWDFLVAKNIKSLIWYLEVNFVNDKWDINEKIEQDGFNTFLVDNGIVLFDDPDSSHKQNPKTGYKVQSSAFKVKEFGLGNVCFHLQQFLSASDNFELLSPDRIRSQGNRGHIENIGAGGETLVGYIHEAPTQQKENINKKIADFLGNDGSIKTKKMQFSGWIELFLSEKFDNSSTNVKLPHISDGILRIIALIAIATQDKANGLLLLDEIEDGINPYSTEKVIGLLRDVVEKSGRQVIATTHSPIILNDITPDNINLLWKDQFGSVHCRKLFSIAELRDSLDFLYPGDALMNMPEAELLAKASSGAGENK